jgi:outer membrane protein assembly factor BamB
MRSAISSLFVLLCLIINAQGQNSRWRYEMDSTMVFSSPRFSDLNGDGVKDVVVGAGMESVAVSHGIVAVDGFNGELLWKIPTSTQIYTSALFQDITGDGIDDIFVGGRAASYFAIDGASGDILWEFFEGSESDSRKAGFLNFFGTQFIRDVNEDGVNDLLVTNGGDYLASPKDSLRPTARLMVLDAMNGSVLHDARVPESRESYYAPHVYLKNNEPQVIFGTGGETVDGSLWSMPLRALLENENSEAKRLAQSVSKGFILNAVIVDINHDSIPDVLCAQMDGKLLAICGQSHETLWKHTFEGWECYVTPVLGQFVGDKTPDFATIIAEGTFPQYTTFDWVIVDGNTGEIAFRKSAGQNQFSPGVAMDLNGDGFDELLYLKNEIVDYSPFRIENQLYSLDFKNDALHAIGPKRGGMSMASAPGIVDFDNDGVYEIVVVTSPLEGDPNSRGIIECIELNATFSPSWPGYLGPLENGIWDTQESK